MSNHYFQGQPVDEHRISVCVLFDPKDGRVVHGHGVTLLDPAQKIEPAEIEARTRRHATNLGLSVDGLKALHVPIEAIRGHHGFKVNATHDGVEPITHPQGRSGRLKRS